MFIVSGLRRPYKAKFKNSTKELRGEEEEKQKSLEMKRALRETTLAFILFIKLDGNCLGTSTKKRRKKQGKWMGGKEKEYKTVDETTSTPQTHNKYS